MASIWPVIRADIEFRHRLRYPEGSGPFGWLRVSLFSRGTLVLTVHRLSRLASIAKLESRLRGRPLGWLASAGRWMVMVMAKAHVANSTRIAAGVCLPDQGHIIIGPLEIGSGTIIHRRVTIGMGALGGGRPRIGKRVWIGPDCVLYGAIEVGDGATVLPGSVVTRHIPPGAVVSGNPPRLIATGFDNSVFRSSLAIDSPSEEDIGGALMSSSR
jgi:serine acetyltransferase